MSAAQCTALLRRNGVGRVAYCFQQQVGIAPIHYAFDGDWIYGRTAPGTKLTIMRHNPWVAFEVDEMTGFEEWKSVVVHGTLYTMAPDGDETERRGRDRGLALLRKRFPSEGPPELPEDTVIFGIHVDEVTGRQSMPGARAPAASMRRLVTTATATKRSSSGRRVRKPARGLQ